MRTVTRIALVIVIAGACKEKQAPPPASPPRQGIEMVHRGAMPHQPLRYQLTRGVRTAVELELDVDMVTPSFQRAMPTTVTVMEVGADEVLADGSAKVRTKILGAMARERPGAEVSLEAVNAQAALLRGVEITGTLTPRGKVQGPRVEASAGVPPKTASGIAALVAQAEEVAMPLPEPGVGVGATWRVRRDVIELGIKMETLTEIEVTSIDGPRVGYVMRTEARGDDQRATIEGTPVDVTKIRGSGTGKGVIDLSRMVVFGEQSVELGFDVKAMAASGSAQSSSVTMRTAKRLKPAAAAATATQPAGPDGRPDGGAAPAPDRAPQDPGAH
jgi:hypothetical protein